MPKRTTRAWTFTIKLDGNGGGTLRFDVSDDYEFRKGDAFGVPFSSLAVPDEWGGELLSAGYVKAFKVTATSDDMPVEVKCCNGNPVVSFVCPCTLRQFMIE
jgi:hypothetical protein